MLADQRRATPNLARAFSEFGETARIIDGGLQLRMLNLLPKIACCVLRIFKDFFHACDRIAEHFTFHYFLEKLCFRNSSEEMSNGFFHAIDFSLCDLGDIKSFPVFLLEEV